MGFVCCTSDNLLRMHLIVVLAPVGCWQQVTIAPAEVAAHILHLMQPKVCGHSPWRLAVGQRLAASDTQK